MSKFDYIIVQFYNCIFVANAWQNNPTTLALGGSIYGFGWDGHDFLNTFFFKFSNHLLITLQLHFMKLDTISHCTRNIKHEIASIIQNTHN